MIKNKDVNIKIIFKIKLKILKHVRNILDSQIDCSTKHHRIFFKNCS